MLNPFRMLVVGWLTIHVALSTAFGGLRDDVERLIRSAALKGGTIAVSIRDCATGAAMVSINAEASMAPASNMKLLTTGAALHALGPHFEFTTKLLRNGDRLIVMGDGDPAFGDPQLLTQMALGDQTGIDVETFLNLWVKPVKDAGIAEVREVVVDDRIFDRQFTHPTWPDDQLNNSYCAQVSGFNFHANVLHFFPRPRPNLPPDISLCQPEAPWLKVINNATSKTDKGQTTTLGINRRMGTNELTFRGNVRMAFREPIAVTVHDMPTFFAQLLADRLNRAGVKVNAFRSAGRAEDQSAAEMTKPTEPSPEVQPKLQQIGPAITTPLSTVIARCNIDSENLYAECLIKRIGFAMTGEPGSWVNGTAIVRHIFLERLSDPALASGIVVMDGSGLSPDNRITATAMTAWLNSFISDEKLAAPFLESLAIAAKNGKLANRFKDTKLYGAVVQAKTGYINRVSCLSGFITMPDGRRRAFSVLVNNLKDPTTVPLAKKLQEQIVGAIAEDMALFATHMGSD
jgi:D-alanyl-D-alanine carboxypeptidase/D-alanyl-D-alanine-endopeptidase (penicillin-binding protein 4)